MRHMREFENRIRGLTEKSWRVEDLTYEDKEGEPFRVYLKARLDDDSELDGKL